MYVLPINDEPGKLPFLVMLKALNMPPTINIDVRKCLKRKEVKVREK